MERGTYTISVAGHGPLMGLPWALGLSTLSRFTEDRASTSEVKTRKMGQESGKIPNVEPKKPVPSVREPTSSNKGDQPLAKVRDDVIRFRCGDEQHLDEALKRIFLYGLGSGVARRNAPVLKKIREEVTEDGKYCLVLVFEAKALELADFEKRQQKFATFFGPGIIAEVGTGEEHNMFDVRLISDMTL
ncbi:thylakoid membrane protein slr0575-like protein [Tanacetum coccineum]